MRRSKKYEALEIPVDLIDEAKVLYRNKFGVELELAGTYLSDDPLCGQDVRLMLSLFGRDKLKAYCIRYCDELEGSLQTSWDNGLKVYQPCKIRRGEYRGQLGIVVEEKTEGKYRVFDFVTGFDEIISIGDLKSRVWRVGERGVLERSLSQSSNSSSKLSSIS